MIDKLNIKEMYTHYILLKLKENYTYLCSAILSVL